MQFRMLVDPEENMKVDGVHLPLSSPSPAIDFLRIRFQVTQDSTEFNRVQSSW